MTNTNIAIIGLIGVGALIFYNQKNDETSTLPTTDPTQPDNGSTSNNNTPQPPYVMNLDLLLQKGSNGPEVRELQKLLGITADGIFGNQTQTALYNKKGVYKTTLNQYKKTPTTTLTPLKIGDMVQAKNVAGAKVYKDNLVNGNHNNTGEYLDTYFWTENIGKIIAMTPDKINCVIFAQGFIMGDRNVWVKTADIELV